MIALIVIGCLIAVGAIALGIYRHDNLHYMDHALEATWAAGFTEKQVVLSDGSTVNYAEGPDNGDAILLIHGQNVAWQDYYTVLPELAKDHHVFAIDCYGHGGSSHYATLYTCEANGRAIAEFIESMVGEPVIISGHSSGGVLAAWVAAYAPQDVKAAVLEDPPLFEVTPEEMGTAPGCWAWVDSFVNIHGYLAQDKDAAGYESDWPVYYAQHSYLFAKFGGLQPKVVDMMRSWRTEHPTGPVTLPWIPHSWLATFYYSDEYDLLFGEAFYDGTWMAGVDQAEMLGRIQCPTIYLKANTKYGDDGMVWGANSDEDAQKVEGSIASCQTKRIESGHDIHVEHPDTFVDSFTAVEAMETSQKV
jgi:pimeloyl-ACP methyl ester carboxylesterase